MTDIDRLIRDLGDRRRGVRTAAVEKLRACGAEAIPALVDLVQSQRFYNTPRFIGWLVLGIFITFFALLPLSIITEILLIRMGFHIKPGSLFEHVDGGIGLGAILIALYMYPPCGHREALAILSDCDDPRAIGTLIDALSYPRWISSPACRALTRLLDRSDPAHLQSILDEDRRRNLYNHLLVPKLYPWRYDLSLALLRTFERLGDTEAIPSVRRLAQGKARMPEAIRLREAAADCLRKLEAEQAVRLAPERLLRPSAEPGDALLRPAQGASHEDDRQLLRPADRE